MIRHKIKKKISDRGGQNILSYEQAIICLVGVYGGLSLLLLAAKMFWQ